MTPPAVLLVSEHLWSDVGHRLRAAGEFEVVVFRPGERVDPSDVERVTVGCLSGDLWPRWSAAYLRCCLDAPHLEWFQSFSAGVDHPVFDAIMTKGTRLTTGSGASATPIAHHVMMLLLALARDLPGTLQLQQRAEWQRRDHDDLEGRVVGVVGLGPIGRETVRMCQAFGMHPIAVRRAVRGDEPCETWPIDRFHELLRLVDDLVLAVPLTADTHQLLGREEFALMRQGTRLVNVGRGELVDENALVEAVRSGHLGGAGLDVFTTEPLPDTSPLWDLPRVILTPHNAGQTALAFRRGAEIFVDNVGRFLRAEPLRNEVHR